MATTAPAAPVDYRPLDHPSLQRSTTFCGSYLVLAFFVVIGSFGVVTGIAHGIGPAVEGGFMMLALAFGYWYWRCDRVRPHAFVGATETPPPDLSPPGAGNIRATIQRRQATFKSGWFGGSYSRHELLCWLTLSETALALAKNADLLDADVMTLEKSTELLDMQRVFAPELARDKHFHYPLRQFLVQRPFYLSDASPLVLDLAERELREGLKRLNHALTSLAERPSARSESFEL